MNVPRLRFNEFKNAWKHKKIAEIMQKISQPVDVESNKMYRQIGIRSHGKGLFHKEPVSGASLGNKRIFWLYENLFVVNIVFAWEQAVAKTSNLEKGMVASHRFPLYKPKDNLSVTDYILYFFLTKKGKYCLGLASPGGAGRNKTLGQKNFEELNVIIPEVDEQTKIANFLTAIDEKITQLTQKCDLLADYKKGVMQQIFSQQLRFKDDDKRDFPNWEEKKFGDIFYFFATNSFSRELLTYDDGVVKNIHYGDIHTKFKSNFKIENENVPFIKDVDVKKIPEDCYCKEGDLIIADASEDYADIGKSIEIINLNNQKLLAGLHTYIARDLSKQMALGFSGYLMQTETVRLQIKTLATGASVLGISKGNLAKVNLNIPSRPEQTKIANFLTAIDDKISHNQTQLNALKQYKQGLLQQLFV